MILRELEILFNGSGMQTKNISDLKLNRAIFGRVVPLRQRPQGMAIMVSMSNIASMLGSTIGGVLTDSVLTWRFCFWINLR
jgi:MFS family permease